MGLRAFKERSARAMAPRAWTGNGARDAGANPSRALFEFLSARGWGMFAAVGAIVLALTGAEALYADLGHFGRRPIQLAWVGFVLPALAFNYLGQGALLMADPGALENPFYRLFPEALLLPAVALATAATVIASQAVISGAYSMTRQAIQLGVFIASGRSS